MNRFEWKIAWRYLGAQKKSIFVLLTSLLAILGVGIGSFALVVVLSGMNGFEEEVIDLMIGKDAHFELLVYHEDPMLPFDSLATIMEKDVDVLATTPFVISKVGISSKRVNDGIVIYGIDAKRSRKVTGLHKQVKWGDYSLDSVWTESKKKLPVILLGNVLSNRLRVILGDKVVLQTFQSPDAMGLAPAPRMVQFVVGGIFESGMYEYDANLAYVSIPAAQKLLGMGNAVSGIQAKITDPMNSRKVSERVHEEIGYPYYTMDWMTRNQTMLKWMALEKTLFGGAILLIILVAVFNIVSSLTMVVLEKIREIGILRGIGVSRASILRIFVLMGAMVGFTGTAGGTLAGLLLTWTQIRWGWFTLPGDVYSLSVLPMKIMWGDVVAIFLLGNLLCLVATIPPAWKASRLDPVSAIRHE